MEVGADFFDGEAEAGTCEEEGVEGFEDGGLRFLRLDRCRGSSCESSGLIADPQAFGQSLVRRRDEARRLQNKNVPMWLWI